MADTVSIMIVSAGVALASALILKPSMRAVQVAIFLALATFGAAVTGPGNLAPAALLVYAFLIALQYEFLRDQTLPRSIAGFIIYSVGLAVGVATGNLEPLQAALKALAGILFLYLMWIAFGKHFRDYVLKAESATAENEQLEALVAERTAELERSLEEKTMLVREIHHRVKNNLGLIDSMLTLQVDTLEDPRLAEIMSEIQNRIHAMALIHEELFRTESYGESDMRSYISSLATVVAQSYGTDTEDLLSFDVHEIMLPMDKAIACGIVVTECVTNSIKYAFPGDRSGTIRIECHRENGSLVLRISDDGVGIPAAVDIHKPESFGLWLIRTMVVKQMRGVLSLSRTHGTAWTAKVPFSAS
jgi:two-component sensor histidine kinase